CRELPSPPFAGRMGGGEPRGPSRVKVSESLCSGTNLMNWPYYLGILVQGLLTGLLYGLMALGLSVIFGVVRVVNFAHGEFTVVAMYGAWLLFRFAGIDPLVAMLPLAAALFGVGY